MEFFDDFCIFGTLIYDIHNKISLLEVFGHFHLNLKICFWDLMDQNMAGSKKVDRIKNYIFDARQPHEEIF